MEPPILIAHRGYAKRYPENTLLAIEAALREGACCVEFDVQFTSDGVPVVLHDPGLKRTTGIAKRIFNVTAAQLSDIRVIEAIEHPKKFAHVGIPTLAAMIDLLQQWPHVRPFVEIKEESIEAFGIERVVRTMVQALQPIMDRSTLICYDALTLRCARAMGMRSIGWILKKYDAASLTVATELTPNYIFCNYTKLPKQAAPLWRGPWKWAFYEVTEPEVAIRLTQLGATYIETMAVAEMLKHPMIRNCNRVDEHAV